MGLRPLGPINIVTLTVLGATLVVRIYRRQILTSKVDPRAARVKLCLASYHDPQLQFVTITYIV